MAKKYSGPRMVIAIARKPFMFLDHQYEGGDEVAIIPPWEVNEAETERRKKSDPFMEGIVVSRPEVIETTYRTDKGNRVPSGFRLIEHEAHQVLPIKLNGAEREPPAEPEPEVLPVEPEHLTRSEVINRLGENLGQRLIDNGYSSLSSLGEASDEELLAIPGIGPVALRAIRSA